MRRLNANLRRVVGPQISESELDALTRDGMRSYLRYWMELFRLPVIAADRITGGMETTGYENLKVVLASGRGAVVALPHTGNWDHAGAWAVLEGMPMATVAERLEPESLFERFVDFRTSLGMEVLPLGATQRVRHAGAAAASGRSGVPGRRPRPHRLGSAGHVLRRHHQDAGRSGDAGRAHRSGADPCDTVVHRHRLACLDPSGGGTTR